MWNIKQEIINGAKAIDAQVVQLPPEECARIRSKILSDYTSSTSSDRSRTWIWEQFTTAVTYADQDGWRWIGDYCSGNETVMLFAEHDEQSMFLFADAMAVAGVIGECFGFEFYLTNRSVDFVLCFNHHDCIIATGVAMNWLEDQRAKRGHSQSS